MIARRLLDELQQLNSADKLEVVRMLQDDLVNESTEWESLAQSQREFRFIPPIRIKPTASAAFLRMLEEESLLDG